MSSAMTSVSSDEDKRLSFQMSKQLEKKPSFALTSSTSMGRPPMKKALPSSLGSRVNIYRVPEEGSCNITGGDSENVSGLSFPDTKQLNTVCLTIATSLIAVFTGVFFVNDAIMKQRDPAWRDYNYTNPSDAEQEVEEQGSRPFAGTAIEAILAPEQFRVYIAIFFTLTIIQAGLGLELLVWISFLKEGWSKDTEKLWHFAQFCFPLLVSAAIGMSIHHEFACMVLIVPGLWKFGLPETFLYFMSAIYSHNPRYAPCMADFLNGWGTAVHHSSVALFVSVLMTGVAPSTPASLSCALPPLVQHWFAMLHYVSPNLYMVIELSLEIWFEWTVFSTFQEVAEVHWMFPLVSISLLVAHWMYLLAAAMELVTGHGDQEDVVSHAISRSKSFRKLEVEGSDSGEEEEMPSVDYEVPGFSKDEHQDAPSECYPTKGDNLDRSHIVEV